MKSFATATALFALAGAATAAPLQRRDTSISCTAKYAGTLHYANFVSASAERTGRIVTQVGDAGLGYAAADATPVQFHFDECTTDGWTTDDGRNFGQVKAYSLGDYTCLTRADDDTNALSFQPCASSNEDDTLKRQWYYANYQTADGDKPLHVSLFLNGNPNDNGEARYYYPNVIDAGQNAEDGAQENFHAGRVSQGQVSTFNLFDVSILS